MFLFLRLFLLIDLVWTSRVPYLVMFSPTSDSVLMPDAMDPSFTIRHRHRMHAYSLETLISPFVSPLHSPEFRLGRDSLYPVFLGHPRLFNRVPIRPPPLKYFLLPYP